MGTSARLIVAGIALSAFVPAFAGSARDVMKEALGGGAYVSFGIGYGGETGGFPILNRRYYGQAPTGAPHGWQMAGAGLGMALGGWIGGPIFDIFGSYDVALWISIATSLAGALNILVLEPTDKLLIPDWEAEEDAPRVAAGD